MGDLHGSVALVALCLGACSASTLDARLGSVPAACSQVLIVQAIAAGSSHATVEAWSRDGGSWRRAFAPMRAVVGRTGIVAADAKREGDGGTPAGLHRIGHAFGYAEQCSTKLDYRQATANDWWIDDPSSPAYNRWVTGKPSVSAEVMRRDDAQYELGAVLDWNTDPVVPGRGSAIFLHVWKGPDHATAGCVALARDDLATLLAWLDPRHQPRVLIVR